MAKSNRSLHGECEMCIRDRCIFHEDDGSLTESYGLMFEGERRNHDESI